MGRFLDDLLYGFRMLFRTPLLSIVAILTIGLGVGLTTHVFSVVYGSVIRGLDIRDSHRFMSVNEADVEQSGSGWMRVPLHDYLDFAARQTSFETFEAGYSGTVNVAGDEGSPRRDQGAFVTAGTLSSLGVPPVVGRTFREGEDEPGVGGTIVLGHDAWRDRWGSDPGVVGTSIRVNGEPMTIIGVMPDGFEWPFDQEVWVSLRVDPETLGRREGTHLQVIGHLEEGVSPEAAQAELASILDDVRQEYPEQYEGLTVAVMPYTDAFMPEPIRAVVWLMLAAVFGVLLVACANVANLLLARAAVREREVAIRSALGASRWSVVRQLLAETGVLAAIGGVVGLVLAHFATRALSLSLASIQKPYWIVFQTDWPALAFTVAVTLAAAVLAGTMPALRATGGNLSDLLRDESRGSSSLRLGRLSTILVVGELAISCALLIAAGFMIRSVINTNTLDMGFEPRGIMTARVGLFETDYPDTPARVRFYRDLLDGLRAEPGIETAALTSHLPSAGSARWYYAVQGEAYATDSDHPITGVAAASEDYFRAMGVEPLQGRDFRAEETAAEQTGAEQTGAEQTGADGPAVAIVNRSFAEAAFPEQDPMGRLVRLGASGSEQPWLRIVGVVPDLYVGGNVGGIGDDQVDPAMLYVPMGHFDDRFMSMVLRARSTPESLGEVARRVVLGLDPDLPIYDVSTMEQVLEDNTWAFELFGSLFTAFGFSSLFLAAVGLYGVMDFSVARRRREMGVRRALGAGTRDIYGLVFRRVFAQLGVGLGLGLVLGFVLSRPLRTVMFEVETDDPVVYLAIVVTLVASGVLASLFPASRATRVDPVTALRAD